MNAWYQKWNTGFNWCFLLYAVFGYYAIGDFGVPLDELTQRHIGLENARYLYGTGSTEALRENGFFGPVFEVSCYLLEQTIYKADLGIKIMLRHAVLFTVFLLALRCFYYLAKRMETARGAAFTATLLFALYPALFAQAHYNSKDTFFMCLVIFSIYFIVRFAQKKSLGLLIAAAAILGISATVRLNAVFVLLALGISMWGFYSENARNKLLYSALLLLFFFIGFYAFYPYLWLNAAQSASDLVSYITANPWPWNTRAAGVVIIPGHLPWWYLFVWMGVTIPVLSILLFLFGTEQLFIKKGMRWNFLEGILVLIFCIPIVYFLLFRPTIYNGWRHLQFLFVPIALMAVIALNTFRENLRFLIIRMAILLYSTGLFIYWHPYGHSYFNEVYMAVGKPGTYDQDYWGLSSLQALKWVAKNDARDSLVISAFTESPELNAMLLPEKDRKRFHFTHDPAAGNYEIQLRREHPFQALPGKVVYHICPLKDTLTRVIKMR